MDLKFAYVALLAGLVLLIAVAYSFLLARARVVDRGKGIGTLLGILGLWVAYVAAVSSTGILQDFSLPPRFPVFLVLPAFLGGAIFLVRFRKHAHLDILPAAWPVAYQTFRIFVELLIWRTSLTGLVPMEATFSGYNFEITAGLSAPIVALALSRNWISDRVAIAWNVAGLGLLAIIVSIFLTTAYAPGLWGAKAPLIQKEFATFPFLLIPAFFMPSAVFMHVLSIIQLAGRVSNAR